MTVIPPGLGPSGKFLALCVKLESDMQAGSATGLSSWATRLHKLDKRPGMLAHKFLFKWLNHYRYTYIVACCTNKNLFLSEKKIF